MRPLLIASTRPTTVGSVPDGWWRDRIGATRRLRDALATLAAQSLHPEAPDLAPPIDVVLVVEEPPPNQRGLPGPETIDVRAASGSGDGANSKPRYAIVRLDEPSSW
jgi:hypothetical protein